MVTNRRLVPTATDEYYTPTWATHALLNKERFHGLIWEPACGAGWMSEVIKGYGYHVVSSTLQRDGGYGAVGVNFLEQKWCAANIVTNPPYSVLDDFVRHGLALSRYKFCILIRLAALAGSRRWRTFYSMQPPSRVYVFCQRITMYPYGVVTGGGGTTEYAWFVWDNEYPNRYVETVVSWIEPGTRELYE